MHGLIHIILKDLVVKKFGDDVWASICKELGLVDDTVILDANTQYDDSVTLKGVVATSTVLGVSVDDALRAFGQHFVTYTSGEYLHMLKSMGDTLPEFVANVNSLHYNVERKFPGASFPRFDFCRGKDCNSFTLSYRSERKERGALLSPVVEGVVIESGRVLYNQNVDIQRLAEPRQGFSTTWKVTCGASSSTGVDTTSDARQVAGGFFAWHEYFVSACTSCAPGEKTADMFIDPPTDVSSMDHALSTMGEDVDAWIERVSQSEDYAKLGALENRLGDSSEPAAMLMRATPASCVAADWDDGDKLLAASEFWSTSSGNASDYAKSMTSPSAHRFVSHSWSPPDDWAAIMGRNCHYSELKSVALRTIADDIGKEVGCNWSEVTFWIDKACIPQNHALMPVCMGLLEDFIQRCDGIVVLLTWHYFSRLWCVYEWAAFLVYHDASRVRMCVDTFLRPATANKYAEAIRDFSIEKAKCQNESDRFFLKAKVKEYYHSEWHFEHFARGTAIMLMARNALRNASLCADAYEECYVPWIKLADELKYAELSKVLRTADPIAWRRSAIEQAGCEEVISARNLDHAWQTLFSTATEDWFNSKAQPLLSKMKEATIIPAVLAHMSSLKQERSEKALNTSTRRWWETGAEHQQSLARLLGSPRMKTTRSTKSTV